MMPTSRIGITVSSESGIPLLTLTELVAVLRKSAYGSKLTEVESANCNDPIGNMVL